MMPRPTITGDADASQRGWQREIEAVTLEEVWATAMRAWRDRRRHPDEWTIVANSVHLVTLWQQRREERGGSS